MRTAQAPAPDAGDVNLPAGKLLVVLYLTTLTFSSFYAPQPLLPALRDEFGVSQSAASLLITVTLLPLSFAPMLYGALLGSVSTRRLLLASVSLLALSMAPIVLAPSYAVVLAARAVQGLLLPAILTALMSYVASHSSGQGLQRAMSLYIGATIFGAFAGRLAAGLLATLAGWRFAFAVLGCAILAGLPPLARRRRESPRTGFARLRLGQAAEVLRTPGALRILLLVFCGFFALAAMLNFLPFRIIELHPGASEARIALMYAGYFIGIGLSLGSRRVVALCGGEIRTIQRGMAFYLAVTPLLAAPSEPVLFVAMGLFCGGMFLVQTTAPGVVNRLVPGAGGVVNGLYLSFYYAGGALGSYLPGFVYRQFGWTAFVSVLAALLAAALALAAGLPREAPGLAARGPGPGPGPGGA